MFGAQLLNLMMLAIAAFCSVLLILLLFGDLAKQFNIKYAATVSYLLLQAMRIYIPYKDGTGQRYIATTEFGGSPFEFWFGLVGVIVFWFVFRWSYEALWKLKEGDSK
ncbi:MAG: hypothetical protein HYV90_05995 [Candidatus Woesebacteria bacterium]|nr:MAG: hypothetical protein HYV90_05995 [Candidatus Woesebacteria bacterium]